MAVMALNASLSLSLSWECHCPGGWLPTSLSPAFCILWWAVTLEVSRSFPSLCGKEVGCSGFDMAIPFLWLPSVVVLASLFLGYL